MMTEKGTCYLFDLKIVLIKIIFSTNDQIIFAVLTIIMYSLESENSIILTKI